jgi:two-component sensor histidine kinase
MEQTASVYSRLLFPSGTAAEEEQILSAGQQAMLDASPDCIKIIALDGRVLHMNRAGRSALNVPEGSSFGMQWLPLLSESVRKAGEDALHRAAIGEVARFAGMSVSRDQITHWDNLLTPLYDREGTVRSILCVSRDVTSSILLEQELASAVEREHLAAEEMRHRVKNLLSVVSGLVRLSQREANNSQEPVTDILLGKLGALARASDAVFAGELSDSDDVGADFEGVVQAILLPYKERCRLSGDAVIIRRSAIPTVALILHELATNAIKYGALSTPEGQVAVRWENADRAIGIFWVEDGGPKLDSVPEHQGFGTEMVQRVISAAGGALERVWTIDGLHIHATLPNSRERRERVPTH